MSPVLLSLSFCTFALGFAEFVAVSLVPAIASDTHQNVAAVGMMIGIYALGVSIGAPTLSAVLARQPRRTVLAGSMLLFAVGNVVTALSGALPLLLASRLLSGLMHGVVMALAASTAVAAADTARSGKAVATVFAGLTIALMLGVPLGTFAGSRFAWQYVFAAIAMISMVGTALLLWSVPEIASPATDQAMRGTAWATVSDRPTLYSTAITTLAYAGSFTGFTYISVLLERHTHLGPAGVTAMFVLYGAGAAVGNALGGKMMDRLGSRHASLLVVAGLITALGGAYVGAASPGVMAVVIGIWGLASFGAVPVLHTAVLLVAQRNPCSNPDIASGMNIAAFNLGITIGSAAGGYASQSSARLPMLAGLLPLLVAGVMAARLASRNRVGAQVAVQ